MSEQEQAGMEFEPKKLTDKYMMEFLNRIADRDDTRFFKNEIDQFFASRIWRVIEQEASLALAQMFGNMLKQGITQTEIAELTAAIRMMTWWLNLKDNLFAARSRSMDLDPKAPGGESWQDRS